MGELLEAVVIGSGFGGAIAACRLSKRWPGQVLVLERGRRYALGSFARTPHEMSNNFWNTHLEKRSRPAAASRIEQRGLFDIRNYRHMDVVLGAGLGGGSLIYANVFMEPPEQVFAQGWPTECRGSDLQPYYAVAKAVLGSRPVPQTDDPRRRIVRTELFQSVARDLGRDSRLVDINVFFGNDFTAPLPQGEQQRNRYGALQTSCVYCGECDVGCNYQAKNTLDLNYLYRAETEYRADIQTERLVHRITALNQSGEDDAACDGRFGYRVYYRDLKDDAGELAVRTRRVIVSAGSLGSSELLLRCRDVFGSLPKISGRLGHHFSGNGDFLCFVLGTEAPANPNHGPVITQRIDFNLFDNFTREHAFMMQDASYPNFLAWFVEGAKPGFLRLGSLWRALRHVVARMGGGSLGPIGFALDDLLSGDLSTHTAVLLTMGLDRANGIMTLDSKGWLDVNWPTADSLALYEATLNAGRQFRASSAAKDFFALPTWWWPFRKNATVHPLGGCILSDTAAHGVTSAARPSFGQVHGYANLYVADGALVPTALGANPTATIAALAERVAEGITGIAPTAQL